MFIVKKHKSYTEDCIVRKEELVIQFRLNHLNLARLAMKYAFPLETKMINLFEIILLATCSFSSDGYTWLGLHKCILVSHVMKSYYFAAS